MGAKYAVIRYLPDPVAGECINVGVIVVGQGKTLIRFLTDWTRVQCFTNKDLQFLKDLEARLHNDAQISEHLPDLASGSRLDEEKLARMARCWHHSIQASPLAGSTLGPEDLMEQIAQRFLKQAIVRRAVEENRNRTFATNLIEAPVILALTELLGPEAPKQLLDKSPVIRGRDFSDNTLGFAVQQKGNIYLGGEGISFSIKTHNHALQNLKAVKYAVSDIKKLRPMLPIGIVMLGPEISHFPNREAFIKLNRQYEAGIEELKQRGAVILSESNAKDWAMSSVTRYVPASLVLDDSE